MDFIEGLAKSRGKDTIMVVVDRYSKYAHFLTLAHHFTAVKLASLFLDRVYKLHGLPSSIVSDKDKVFLSIFWKELFNLLQTKLVYSSTYHPQTDGQTERVNRCLENYLRCMTSHKPVEWSKWISLAEFWYNSNYHSATQMTPFKVVYVYDPPQLSFELILQSKIAVVDQIIKERQLMARLLKENLKRAQSRMKFYADKNRTEREFMVGDWVFIKLQPYRQTSIVIRKSLKLVAKFYGPYQIIKKISLVAYKLQLLPSSKIHSVFTFLS